MNREEEIAHERIHDPQSRHAGRERASETDGKGRSYQLVLKRCMTDQAYINELMDGFFDGGRIDIAELNEIAASLADPLCRTAIWERLLERSKDLRDPERREDLAIAVFELLAEPPVNELWLEALPVLLATPQLHWAVCRAYLHQKAALVEHLEILGVRFESDGQ